MIGTGQHRCTWEQGQFKRENRQYVQSRAPWIQSVLKSTLCASAMPKDKYKPIYP